mmetsp:Transcript_81824/g.190085  ORF Transcript_81824/g.190085 Transcript_81824/m.190085 type:complete len:101 (+) Transcript_81824:534-836(+)
MASADLVQQSTEATTVTEAIMAVGTRLHDNNIEVRLQALNALMDLADRGDSRAVQVISQHYNNLAPGVRTLVMEKLGKVMDKGNVDIITAVRKYMDDEFP